MARTTTRRLAAGLSLALALLAGLGGSQAHAECAQSYVVAHRGLAAGTAHFAWLVNAGSIPGPADGIPKGPCAGLSCSRVPELPLAPAPAPLVPSEPWGCLPSTSVELDRPRFHRTGLDPEVRPVHRPTSVFHPPR